ncbi:GspH/FimT family pseudopilin [Noviherbaspirillum galbum]|uniref:Type II secretion system protein H n=1 Tax=Noviherbaspirillum galbum TaxID=2709383 RepID=A0A6B3SRL1_9BURK|nr:GspH/FimT family pseudopilin [Noviherbaspirillum galbum]NEX60289.1 prepilin-type N-terminal cleavage/methylation domain-containing protein [Noviherbaspirillum galbum]
MKILSPRVPCCPRRPQRGLTMVEVLITLAVGGVMFSMAGPAFTEMIARQRMKSAATDIYIALAKARSEALRLNANVTLQAVNASQWDQGWYIADPDASVSKKLLEHGATSRIAITGSNVTYRPSGRITGSTAPSFSISSTAATTKMCVNVDLSGRPYQKSVASNSSC